jgi:hypothetical protein
LFERLKKRSQAKRQDPHANVNTTKLAEPSVDNVSITTENSLAQEESRPTLVETEKSSVPDEQLPLTTESITQEPLPPIHVTDEPPPSSETGAPSSTDESPLPPTPPTDENENSANPQPTSAPVEIYIPPTPIYTTPEASESGPTLVVDLQMNEESLNTEASIPLEEKSLTEPAFDVEIEKMEKQFENLELLANADQNVTEENQL